jgi:hypothetical protein
MQNQTNLAVKLNMNPGLQNYLSFGHRKVEGWLTPLAMSVMERLATVQNTLTVEGSICEIGVHHGKFFILLHLLSNSNELSIAYDLFDRQDENVDHSGHGDLEQFIANMKSHACEQNRIRVFSENSLTLTREKILEVSQSRIRIFSIDGGHSAANTINDLSLAADTLVKGGLVVVDDFFNEPWPGVSEGVCKYICTQTNCLYPIVIAGNKFIFTNDPEYATLYRRELENLANARLTSKLSEVFSNPVVILTVIPAPTLLERLTQSNFWAEIRHTIVGKAMRSVYRRCKQLL